MFKFLPDKNIRPKKLHLPKPFLKQEEHHHNIYVIYSGLQSTRAMKDFDEKLVKFIILKKIENLKIEFFLDEKKLKKWNN